MLASGASLPKSSEISSKEEDHLIRSTKKVKEIEHVVPDEHMVDHSPTVASGNLGEIAGKGTTVTREEGQPRFFKQVLLNARQNEKAFDSDLENLSSDEDLLSDGEGDKEIEVQAEWEQMNPDIPKVTLPRTLIRKIRRPWKDCLIVRLLGRNIGFKVLCNRVHNLWGLQGDFEVVDLGVGFFLFKFEMKQDFGKVVLDGP
ncbi:hypothetical protein LOK49_LG14G01351 [Camellia lanceoleosa]|uniref:Uncharacterized protein n=1 Tax=Camellia lanceoleosa TaxID=1840588 RepID=A0ACC0FAQ7_9ERIC|nr:hypothetical protein LOK49_LG14G01351 [Camellia lanceoleosa]